MSYIKTAEDVKSFLPHGALMVQDNVPAIPLVSLEVKETERGTPILIGWAYPNKNFNIELENVLHQPGGWLCFSGGKRVVLRPLDEETGRRVLESID